MATGSERSIPLTRNVLYVSPLASELVQTNSIVVGGDAGSQSIDVANPEPTTLSIPDLAFLLHKAHDSSIDFAAEKRMLSSHDRFANEFTQHSIDDDSLGQCTIYSIAHSSLCPEDLYQFSGSRFDRGADLIVVDARFIPEGDWAWQRTVIESREANIPVLVLGSFEKADFIASLIKRGASDYVMPPENAALLEAKLVSLFDRRDHSELMSAQKELISANNKFLIHEQELAKSVFNKVTGGEVSLPNVQSWLSPIAVFNGDVFLAVSTPSGKMISLLGDFTGHGLGAALGAIPLAATFYGMAKKGFGFRDIVAEINQKLYETLPTGVFCCATVIEADFQHQRIQCWNGGLPTGKIFSSKGELLGQIESKALPLGILPASQFSFVPEQLSLQEGARIYLYSDGILEAENDVGQQFGEQRLERALEYAQLSSQGNRLGGVEQQLQNFLGNEDPGDDISLIEITMLEKKKFVGSIVNEQREEKFRPASWCNTIELRPSSITNSDPIPQILQWLLEEPYLKSRAGELFSIVSELYNNALDHGVLRLESSRKNDADGYLWFYRTRQQRLSELQEGVINFTIDYQATESECLIAFEICDSGPGFLDQAASATLSLPKIESSSPLEEDNSAALHGRGIMLVRSLCEDITYYGKGNRVKAVYRTTTDKI